MRRRGWVAAQQVVLDDHAERLCAIRSRLRRQQLESLLGARKCPTRIVAIDRELGMVAQQDSQRRAFAGAFELGFSRRQECL